MHTISMLRRALGLSSDNQVRNRMERIKDLLAEHVRRGPNNQIFLTDPGLEIMRQFQELHDTGLTLAEASAVVRSSSYNEHLSPYEVSSRSTSNDIKPISTAPPIPSELLEELALIRTQLEALQSQLPSSFSKQPASGESQPWWTYLREDTDVT